ncbi:MAG: ABC transporter substrate-binding protein [Paracoccus sp. (in: a-proteobacteria)]|nr:ABC transporter substrate-binding protein [Paracoccus sp. (in: a-proteobacteria)]
MKKALYLSVAMALVAGSAQAETLRMSWWGGDARHAQTQEALQVCGAKHGHTIQPEFTGWSGHQERITTQIAGRTEADIMQINWPWLPLFSRDGTGFVDLNDYAHIIDLSQWSEEQLAGGMVNGHLNGLPTSDTGRVFMFNRTTFEEAGLEVPRTWADVLAAAPVFKEELGANYYPLEAATLNALLIVTLVTTQATGKDMIDPETTRVAWTEEELAQGIQFYLDLVEAGAIRSWRDVAGEGNVELFETRNWAEGRLAGSYEWDSTYAKYADPLDEGQVLEPVALLQIDGAVTEGLYRKPSMLFAISRNSAHPEAAAQIIDCLFNDPEAIDILRDSRGIPANKVAFDRLEAEGALDPTIVAAHRIIEEGEGPTVHPLNEHPRVRSVFQDNLEMVAYGQLTPEQAAQEIISGIDSAIRSFR